MRATNHFYLRTLGEVGLHAGGPEGERLIDSSRALLLIAWLATNPEHSVRRDFIATLLWPEAERTAQLRSLRQMLYYLKKKGIGRLLVTTPESVRLRHDMLQMDVQRFEELVANQNFQEACEIYKGPFLAGLRDLLNGEIQHWIDARDEGLRVAFQVATVSGVQRELKANRVDEALRIARHFADLEPLDEQAQQLLVRCLLADGQKASALMAYEQYASLLERALEDEPEAELATRMDTVREELLATDQTSSAPKLWDQPTILGTSDAKAHDEPASTPVLSFGQRYALPLIISSGLLVLLAFTLPKLIDEGGSEPAGYVVMKLGRDDPWQRFAVREERLEPVSAGAAEGLLGRRSVPVPGDAGVAISVATESGFDVHYRPADSDSRTVVVADSPAEERALDWSPDGRWLLYSVGRSLDGGREYERSLWMWDRKSQQSRALGIAWPGDNLDAEWSPDGGWILLSLSERIDLVRPRGTERVQIVPEGDYEFATWSPDGRQILYANNDVEGASLEVQPVRGRDARRVTHTDGRFLQASWIADSLVIAVHGIGGSVRLMSVNPVTGEQRELQAVGPGFSFNSRWSQALESRWVSNVQLADPITLAVGIPTDLEVFIEWSDGRRTRADREVLDWRILSTPIEAPKLKEGQLTAPGPGPMTIEASYGGWRADTLTVRAAELVETEVAPAFVESWSEGLVDDRWESLGTPPPYSRSYGGPEDTGVFATNGDSIFHSGAVTRSSFSASRGLTVEVWGKIPLTGRHYEDFGLALARANADRTNRGLKDELFTDSYVRFHVVGGEREAGLASSLAHRPVEWPSNLETWRRYSLQASPEGDVLLLIDGKPHAMVRQFLDPGFRDNRIAVGLFGRSAYPDIEILHGPVTVVESMKYKLPTEP